MNVREVIEALQDLDQDAEVWTEGCDCMGTVGRVDGDGSGVNLWRP